jgi:positive regulator of sigma E activity
MSAPDPTPVLEREGTVLAGDGASAVVGFEALAACQRCGAGAHCPSTAFTPAQASAPPYRLRLPNELGLVPGDRVVCQVDPRALLGSAALVYLGPLSLLLVAAGLAEAAGVPPGLIPLAGLTGLALGLLGLRPLARRLSAAARPVAVRAPAPSPPPAHPTGEPSAPPGALPPRPMSHPPSVPADGEPPIVSRS